MNKPVMFGPREYVIRKTKLLDPTESLKKRRVDDFFFPLGDWDKTIDDVEYAAVVRVLLGQGSSWVFAWASP